ncbi:MAG TPA: type II secretion system F family protein [Syntrophomonadaceae bacterium]|nr:type II secretion system F family protein [Syntrophomonadaceae bacterium]
MKFKYRIRDASGLAVSGFLEGEHKKAIINGLLQQGYAIVALREVDSNQSGRELQRPVRVGDRELAAFTRQMALMLAAGLPLMHCLQLLQQQTRGTQLKGILDRVGAEVRSGSGLGEALSHYPQVFPLMYINTVKAGEASGALDTVFQQLSSHLQKREEFNRKLKSASAYPIFTTILAVVILVLMIIFVIPRFVSIFAASGIQLPWPTRVLLNAGSGIRKAAPWLLGVAGSWFLVLKYSTRTEGGRLSIDSLKLKLPVVGSLERKKMTVAITSTLGMLLQAGVPILQAMRVAAGTMTNGKGREVLHDAMRSISSGESLAAPLARSGIFPPMLTDMIAVGEATGSLDTVLDQLALYCEMELSDSLESLARMTEPLLILLVAAIVGGMVIALLLPMMNMVSMVGV